MKFNTSFTTPTLNLQHVRNHKCWNPEIFLNSPTRQWSDYYLSEAVKYVWKQTIWESRKVIVEIFIISIIISTVTLSGLDRTSTYTNTSVWMVINNQLWSKPSTAAENPKAQNWNRSSKVHIRTDREEYRPTPTANKQAHKASPRTHSLHESITHYSLFLLGGLHQTFQEHITNNYDTVTGY